MDSALIPNCNAEGQLYWSSLLLEKDYPQFTSCHNNVIWYMLNGWLIFFNISVCHSLTTKIGQWQWSCVVWVIAISAFERLLYLCFCRGYFWQGVNAQIAVLVTMEKISCRKAYGLFSEDGQTLYLPNFPLTCSSEVHFVPVVFRLKIPLAHTCFLLAFAICSVIMEERERWGSEWEANISWKPAYHKRNECSSSLIVWFCLERTIAWLSWKWVYWRLLVQTDVCLLVPPLVGVISLCRMLDCGVLLYFVEWRRVL